jgi:hypothetical protein
VAQALAAVLVGRLRRQRRSIQGQSLLAVPPLRPAGNWAMTGLLASWAGLEAGERVARLRALAALARVFAGPDASAQLVRLLRIAESDRAYIEYLDFADIALRGLPSTTARRILSVMAELCHADGQRHGDGA